MVYRGSSPILTFPHAGAHEGRYIAPPPGNGSATPEQPEVMVKSLKGRGAAKFLVQLSRWSWGRGVGYGEISR